MTATDAPLEIAFTVECSPPHAFEVWAQRTSLWWPTQPQLVRRAGP